MSSPDTHKAQERQRQAQLVAGGDDGALGGMASSGNVERVSKTGMFLAI